METSDKPDTGGTKYDTEKPRMELLDPEFLVGVAQVMTFGAQKYEAHNWRKGIAFSRLIAAALRHLMAIMIGKNADTESGLPHVYHLGCCIMFLSWMMVHRPDLDDRYGAFNKLKPLSWKDELTEFKDPEENSKCCGAKEGKPSLNPLFRGTGHV